jgi:hypothetical protein
MPLTYNGLKISHLSGPTSLLGCAPNMSYFEDKCKVETGNFPIIIMLGDIHNSKSHTCKYVEECKEQESFCVSLLSPLWFRMLDSLVISGHHIDYFIESFIYPPFLQMNELFDDEWDYNIVSLPPNHVLTFIPNFHPKCLHQDSSECMTNNINYQLVDFRYTTKDLSLPKHLHMLLVLTTHFMKTREGNLHTFYKMALQYINLTPSDTKPAYDLKLIPRAEVKNTHMPYFESYLHFVLTNSLSANRCEYKEGYTFFDKKGIHLLALYLDNKEEFVVSICNHVKFISTSICYQQMLKSPLKIQECIKLLAKFIHYHLKTCPLTDDMRNTIKKGIEKYDKDTHSLLMNIRGIDHESDDVIERCNEYVNICEIISSTIVIPFVDFYMWLRSLKLDSLSKCRLTVYHAGDFHTQTLYSFLCEEERAYSSIFGVGNALNSDELCYPRIMPYIQPYRMDLAKIAQFRCLDLSSIEEQISLEDIILFSLDEKVRKKANKARKINKRRLRYLGKEFYLSMLKGKTISSDTLNNILEKHPTLKYNENTLANRLHLVTTHIPKQYKDSNI